MELTCEQLGITPADIVDRVAEKIAKSMLVMVVRDYDDETGSLVESETETVFQGLIRKRVSEKIALAVDALADKYIGRNLEGYLETMTFPQTNVYGEKKSEPLTLLEYIAQRAGTYLTEKVDYQGRTGYNAGNVDRTRVVWMLEQFLTERMREEFSKALATANQQIVNGIAATLKDKLAEIAAKLKCEVKAKP